MTEDESKLLTNEELLGKLCTMYSLYPFSDTLPILWKETMRRLDFGDGRNFPTIDRALKNLE